MRTFRPTRGLFVGAIGVVACVAAGVLFVATSWSLASVQVCLVLWLFGWLIWAVLVRPCVRLGEREVHVVGSLRTALLPAERISTVSMRQYLVIEAGERSYTCAAIGHSRRALGRSYQDPLRGLVVDETGRASVASQAERVRELIEEAAAAARRRPRSPVPEIRSTWDRLPVGIALALVAALAVAAVVGAAT